MKRLCVFITILTCMVGLGQTGGSAPASISADLPKITPPSPTVASLMKFEEVPVNNYTGIPEISIPLYSVPTLSKDISLDLSLKYHPASIAVKEVASYTGLGWNLIGGGTISRMVRGLPDEVVMNLGASDPSMTKVGIYQDYLPNNTNNFYQVLAIGGGGTPAQQDVKAEYFWGAFEKGMYDSEHDLYQYNFMGHTGRFYVRYNGGALEPVKLDNDNSVQITLSYTGKTINSFTLYDDKGYKFIFNVKEITTENGDVRPRAFNNNFGTPSPAVELTYTSAYHLSEVTDNNDKTLISITYQDAAETTSDYNSVINTFTDPTIQSTLQGYMNVNQYEIWGLLPVSAVNSKTMSVITKKILEIQIKNKAKISFAIAKDREDTNINRSTHDAPKLTNMVVKNWAGDTIKRIKFEYDYAQINDSGLGSDDNSVSRLILTNVLEWHPDSSENITHTCHYKNQNISSNGVSTDYWGYYKSSSPGRETDEDYCTTGVLTQLDLPTKGRIVFDFGPNTYSYVGDQPVTDFGSISYTADPIIQIPLQPGDGTGKAQLVLSPTIPEHSAFRVVSPESGGGSFRLRNTTDSSIIDLNSFGFKDFNDGSAPGQDVKLNPNYQYTIEYERSNTTGSATARVQFFRGFTLSRTDKWLYGGGVRINKISYFADDSENPSKEKHFNYNFFNDANRSSGSLVFAKPVFKYYQSRQIFIPNSPIVPTSPSTIIGYSTTTTSDNLLKLRTKGSDVGYQNVTVWETGNGKSEYTYKSPIDYPESNYTITYPFIPPVNVDYKRGLLTNEKHYSQSGTTYQVVKETIYDYPVEYMDEVTVRTGITAYNISDCPAAQNYDSYSYFKYCDDPANNCTPIGWQAICYPQSYLSYKDVNFAYGWPKLKTKTNKEYFYPQSSDQRILTTTETFEYNSQNKRLSKSTITNSVGEVLSTEYAYDTNTAGRNRIGEIKTIQTKRGSSLLDKKEILYSNSLWGSTNTAYLPSTVSIQKGTTAIESRLKFEKYDEYSNPIEAKLENGTPVVYIWGYDNSLPVAIIENITYSSISSSLINDVKTASAQTAFYNEGTLLTKLGLLRAGLPASAMVTTITHKPLVGVSTMTDPKGMITHYFYDEFNRLKKVTDADDKVLSENEYHYKP